MVRKRAGQPDPACLAAFAAWGRLLHQAQVASALDCLGDLSLLLRVDAVHLGRDDLARFGDVASEDVSVLEVQLLRRKAL